MAEPGISEVGVNQRRFQHDAHLRSLRTCRLARALNQRHAPSIRERGLGNPAWSAYWIAARVAAKRARRCGSRKRAGIEGSRTIITCSPTGSSAGTLTVMALGAIAADNASHTPPFVADKSFLVWGHNNGATTVATPVGGLTDAFHMARIWKAQETGTVGSVMVRIPASLINLVANETAYLIRRQQAGGASPEPSIRSQA